MAKYLKQDGKNVPFMDDEVKVDTKGRLYIMVEGVKTEVKKVNGVILLKEGNENGRS